MHVVGAEYLEAVVAGELAEAKLVLGERGAVFGPITTQHRDLRGEGVAYADDYRGNALAAIVRRGAIELRFHRDFADAAVARLIGALAAALGPGTFAGWKLTYQGRPLATM